MNMAKYSIGQEVLFRCHAFPAHWNRRVTIERIMKDGDEIRCRKSGEIAVARFSTSETMYLLDLIVADDYYPREYLIEERYLFPIPDLSEDSFEEMMEKLKNPVDVCP